MEKQKPAAGYKSKNKIMRFLPKAAISLQNPHLSPSRDKRPEINLQHKYFGTRLSSKAFSGPIASMVPTEEPTSPKVSCMGRIKHKRMVCKKKHSSLSKEFKHLSCFYSEGYSCDGEKDVFIPEWVADAGWRLEPRKEVNLWKRRTVAQPKPLLLSI